MIRHLDVDTALGFEMKAACKFLNMDFLGGTSK